jgi:1-acyl-sn-glycerol-3-phosphate acyltransferase
MLTVYIVAANLVFLIMKPDNRRRQLIAKMMIAFTHIFNWVNGFKLIVKGRPSGHESYLMVCNHTGILDVFAMLVQMPAMFVTSVEMRDTPGLGYVCRLANCFFVERRSRSKIKEEIDVLRGILKSGLSVMLYPEGTSTNGVAMLPFKKSLLTAAAGTGCDVLPLVINYKTVNGEPMSWKWRNHIYWYGDHPFALHACKLMSLKSVVAEIEFLRPIACHSDDERRAVALQAYQQIQAKFIPIPLGPGEVSTMALPKSLMKMDPSLATKDEDQVS